MCPRRKADHARSLACTTGGKACSYIRRTLDEWPSLGLLKAVLSQQLQKFQNELDSLFPLFRLSIVLPVASRIRVSSASMPIDMKHKS